jgi:hypothetical protein
MKHRTHCIVLLVVAALLVAGCTTPVPASSPSPRIFFVEPADGATLASPVRLVMGAEAFTVEAAGEIRAGAGHLHIMVDADCVAAGEVIPKDETHIHYGQGQMEAELALAPGEHTLCLQAADGAHFALPGAGMPHQLRVTVQ